MLDFNYLRPQTLSEALAMLAEYGDSARILAGGTDLMIYLRSRRGMKGVKHIIDTTYLPDLDYIREEGGALHIGPLAAHANIAESDLVMQHAGLLAAASAAVGSPQIRNRGTIGGNIVNAAVCADTVPPLVALDAQVKLEGAQGSRRLPLEDFITGPNRTQRGFAEMLTEVSFAKLSETAGWGFVRLARREALAIARMNVAVIMDREDGETVSSISIAPGSVLPSPARIMEAEQVLLGSRPSPALIRRAGEAVAAKMLEVSGRRWSTDYKEPVLIALVERAIKQAMGVEWK